MIEDFFNLRGLRNADNTDSWDYNCGGFALGTFSWYEPFYFNEDGCYLCEDLAEEGYGVESIQEILCNNCVDSILEDFGEKIRVVSREDDLKVNEELIAFRVDCGFESDYESQDFHFRVFRDGRWQEKNGHGMIHDADDPDEDIWNERYLGPTIYLAKLRT